MKPPVDLRCERRIEPVGISAVRPSLSWRIHPGEQRNQWQAAWQIQAAASAADLIAGERLLWDSDRVESDALRTQWGGPELAPRQAAAWRVRVWDEAGEASAWSEPARFTLGLLADADWQAEWIGSPADWTPLTADGLAWHWHPADIPAGHDAAQASWLDVRMPAVLRTLRRTFTLPQDAPVLRARFLVTVNQQFQLFLNGLRIASSNWQPRAWSEPQVVNLQAYLDAGEHTLALEIENVADNPGGVLGRLLIEFTDRPALQIDVDGSWTADAFSDGAAAGFAAPVAALSEELREKFNTLLHGRHETVYLRREFAVQRPLRRALLHATALGVMELWLNGARVTQDILAPGWTDFAKRIHTLSYDVTAQLAAGGNTLAAIAAPGWYCGYLGWRYDAYYGKAPRLKAQLELEYEDGSRELVATDAAWQAAFGPHIQADLLMGEHYDARLEQAGWNRNGFDAAAWSPARVDMAAGQAPLEPHRGVPVRTIEELAPVAFTTPEPGVHIFDMAQNMVGWVRLRLDVPRGTRIVLRHGEMLNPDGSLYVTNLRRARATDVYIARGGGETWEPRFTFHGFRYVEIRGLPAAPTLETIRGVVIHSAIERTGEFECSSPMLNQLFSNISWGHRGNYLEVPTDCPQRDERLGWTGDAQVFIRTASYLSRIDNFFNKWLVDLEDTQNAEGCYADIAPNLPEIRFGSAAWTDAATICPYMLWQAYGDTAPIRRHWPAMQRYMQFLEQTSEGLIRQDKSYGDWLSVEADTDQSLIATAYFAWNSKLMAEMAEALGDKTESKAYYDLFERIRSAFATRFSGEDGRLSGDSQTAYVLALHFGLLDEAGTAAAVRHLAADIRARGNRLSVGFVGISYLCPALARHGELDLAYTLLTSEEYPSWGYEIRNGATTIWERWNSYTHASGFGDVRMNSFNHYAFGSIGEWMFDTVAGIRALEPGYRRVAIAPRPGGGLTHAALTYQSIRGPIRSAWRLEQGRLELEVTIPPNTAAELTLPTTQPESIREGGTPWTAPAQPVGGDATGEGVQLLLGSGSYRFSCAFASA